MAPMLEERARNSPVDDVMYQIYPKYIQNYPNIFCGDKNEDLTIPEVNCRLSC